MRIHLAPNPVLVKELRGRMRGARAYIFLTATLALMGAVSYGLYRIALATSQPFIFGASVAPGAVNNPPGFVVGQCAFVGLVFLAVIIICAIAPALTANAISGEHERKTFDLLVATPLHASSILLGKLLAALSYVALIVLAAIPLASLSFTFGGVATIDMLQALLLLLGFALTFGVVGLFFSALFRRSGHAVVASYIVLALFIFGTGFLYIVLSVVRGRQPPQWLLALNPLCAMASALVIPPTVNNFSTPGMFPVMPMLWTLSGGNFDARFALTTPLWRYTVGLYAFISIVLFLLSTQLMKPVRRFRLRARTWAMVVLLCGALLLGAYVVYAPALAFDASVRSGALTTPVPVFFREVAPIAAPISAPPIAPAPPTPTPAPAPTRTPTATRAYPKPSSRLQSLEPPSDIRCDFD